MFYKKRRLTMTNENKQKQQNSTTEKISEAITPKDQEEVLLEYQDYQKLTKELAEMEQKANEHKEAMLRAKADLENMQRRVEKEIANAHKYGLEKFAGDLLAVVDSLEQGLNTCRESLAKTGDTLLNSVGNGMEMTINILLSVFKKFGIEQINPLGEDFNHDFHEAISTLESADAKPNSVIQVLQKGYTLNGRLMRPALVIVAKTKD